MRAAIDTCTRGRSTESDWLLQRKPTLYRTGVLWAVVTATGELQRQDNQQYFTVDRPSVHSDAAERNYSDVLCFFQVFILQIVCP